jgi:hypothetical protein
MASTIPLNPYSQAQQRRLTTSQISRTTFCRGIVADEMIPKMSAASDCSHLVCQYAGERRDPYLWILDTKDYRIESRVLSHIFLRTLRGTWWNIAETRHSQERL